MNALVAIAEAVKSQLESLVEGLELGEPVTIARRYRLLTELSDRDGLQISVIHRTRASSRRTRGAREQRPGVDVAVQIRATESVAELDALVALVQTLEDGLFATPLVELPEALLVDCECVPYAPDHLEELGLFTSVLRLTYRI